MLYGKLEKKVSKKRFIEIMRAAVDIEIEFITEAIPCRLIGMNSDLMIQYIKFVADRLALQLGYDKIYGDKNPFDFMEKLSLDMKTNFFEHRVSSYSLANKTNNTDTFDLDNCF
jgi:ribonucleotide reductase beta subunit family protein with ferritin-like domain